MAKRVFLSLFILWLLGGVLVGAQENRTLSVFAASSLTDAFLEIERAFEAQNGGVDVLLSFGGSSSLAAQLAEGAPADVFASANMNQMEIARESGRISGLLRTFAKNRLVLIAPADNPAEISTLRDLAKDDISIIVAAPAVPVRDYTDLMLAYLAADPNYGEAYRQAVIANIVSEEDNVRQVAAKVALGEVDAGMVYASDVTPDIADRLLIIPIPDNLNTIATYPIALTNNPTDGELAQQFVDFVLGDAGQDILVKWNFISVRIPELHYTITMPVENGLVTLDGQVLNPYTLTADILRANFSAEMIAVTYQNGTETLTTTFTGVPLWQVLNAAQPNFNADILNDKLSMFIVVTGRDGYQVTLAWAEIDPDYAGQPILLAYEQEGAPLAAGDGPVRLIVAGALNLGRDVRDVANISLRDAPAP